MELLKLKKPRCFSMKTGKEVIEKIPQECEKCIHRHLCLEYGFAKDKKGCLARSQPKVNSPSLSQKNTKEDGFPPTPKGMGIQPTIL